MRGPDVLRGAVIQPIRGRRTHLEPVVPGIRRPSSNRAARSSSIASPVFPSCFVWLSVRVPLASGTHPNAVGVIEEWDGSAWSVVPNPQSSGVDVSSSSSLSCPSTTSCFAVGQDNTDGGFIDRWDGSSWTMALNQQAVSFAAVSCSTSTSCVTVGAGPSVSGSIVVLVGGTWTAESVPYLGTTASFTTVPRASPTFCMAVGSIQVGGVGWATSLTEAWDGASGGCRSEFELPRG